MSYGPNPWHQQHWDIRAATNFMAGGAGSGLIACAALAGLGPAWGPVHGTAPAWPWPLLLGAALVGLGLFAVWLEIGRPLRALNVFLHPKTSWMTREAFAGAALMAAVLAALLWPSLPALSALAGLAALAFVYCQGRILRAARGIPAWREPLVVPLVVSPPAWPKGQGCGPCCRRRCAAATLPTTLLLLAALLATARAVAGLAFAPHRRAARAEGDRCCRPALPRRHARRAGARGRRAARAAGSDDGRGAAARRLAGAGRRPVVQVHALAARRLQPGLRAAAPAGARRAACST
ncbi:MAG: hypothetical protein U1F49_11045 [Rubrivivax sp.]